MAVEDARAGLEQARLNESNWGFFAVEALIFAALGGLAFQSWWAFGGILLGLPLVLLVPYLGAAVMVLISGAYALTGYLIVSGLSHEQAGAIVTAILVFLVSLGVHFGAATYAKDLGR